VYRNFGFIQGLMIVAIIVIYFLVISTVNTLHAEEKMSFTIKSTVFTDGGTIPSKYTCEGKDVSPPLTWEGVPGNTRSLVLIVDDPDAPDPKAPRMTWIHWVLYNIPPDASGLAEGGTLPAGTEEGLNDWKRIGYGGPCPPIGRHRYFHKLYALDTVLKGLSMPDKSQVEKAMKGHIIAKTELVGTYEK
jgi:Raf kinase inhibitor-like YbhB/YbcL family protein